MCGIAGALGCFSQDAQRTLGQHFVSTLKHRGPDAQNVFCQGDVLFAHTRLAIQDIQNGHQPFTLGDYTLVFNGEIYNHLALRQQWLGDVNFCTQSDTETLLWLYRRFGKKAMSYIDGMFAFALYDASSHQVIFGSDVAGKKPLYYCRHKQGLIFASELNALASCVPLELHHDALRGYLRYGFFMHTSTPYRHVYRLPKATLATYDLHNDTLKQEAYFDVSSLYRQPKLSYQEGLECINERLSEAIQNRLCASQVPVGAFLSGGIDSGLIVGMAMQYVSKLDTFTVRFDEGSGFDESHLAALVAKRYGTKHHEIRIGFKNLDHEVQGILEAYGEPFFDSSAIPSFYVAKAAKAHTTVILNGDGADELFGGYRRYMALKHLKWLKYLAPIKGILNALPPAHRKKSLHNYLYRALRLVGKEGVDLYLAMSTDIFEDLHGVDSKDFDAVFCDRQKYGLDTLDRASYLDFEFLLYGNLLKKMDIATMYHALEGRSPFLSRSVIQAACRIHPNHKLKGTTTKYILRQLAQSYLPQTVINQPKRGFEIPLKDWVNGQLQTPILDTISSGFYEQFLPKAFVESLVNQKLKVSQEKRAKMLWAIFSLEVWHNHYKKLQSQAQGVAFEGVWNV